MEEDQTIAETEQTIEGMIADHVADDSDGDAGEVNAAPAAEETAEAVAQPEESEIATPQVDEPPPYMAQFMAQQTQMAQALGQLSQAVASLQQPTEAPTAGKHQRV